MKVLHVIPALSFRYGGPSAVVLRLCEELIRHSVEVAIATTDADGSSRMRVPRGRMVEFRGVPTIFFPRRVSESFKFSPRLAWWLSRNVRQYDLVHVHGVFNHSSLAAGRAARREGVPYLVRPLGTLSPWSMSRKAWRKRALWRLGAAAMVRNAVALHVTGDMERAGTAPLVRGGRYVSAPLGVDDRLLEEPGTVTELGESAEGLPAPPYVLFLSRIHPKKRLLELVEAFGALVDSGTATNWRLIVAGEGSARYERSILRKISAEGWLDRVHLIGWVEGERKRSLLRRASVFALPSHQENFGLAVAEAMACGVPVLVTDTVGVAPDVRSAGAGWVVGLDGEGLRSALEDAIARPEERRRRGAAGRRWAAARYAWPSVAREIVRAYREILEEPVGVTDSERSMADS